MRYLPRHLSFSALAFTVFTVLGSCTMSSTQTTNRNSPWDMEALYRAPRTYPATDFKADGVQAIFYEGPSWQGRPTRVFAWYGIPAHKAGEKVPGLVLVHGGGGTAFAEWVRLWTQRGYAAIAMDTCGSVPGGEHGKRPRHEWSGPPGWGGFDQIDRPVQDQWPYQAVADVILAHSLLRSFPEVDANRIGITGISWGGYLTCIAAGIDPRFRFAVPVYGCGFLGEDSTWLPNFKQMGPEKTAGWLNLWDPSRYLPQARMPFLWVDGTNDFAYPLNSVQKSYRLPPGERTLCTRVRMPHGHGGPGEKPEEIHAFANSLLKDGVPLASITGQGRDGDQVWVTYQSATPMARAELNYTADTGPWKDRVWQTLPAELDAVNQRVTARLPAMATVFYCNITDQRGLIVSSEHVEIKSTNP